MSTLCFSISAKKNSWNWTFVCSLSCLSCFSFLRISRRIYLCSLILLSLFYCFYSYIKYRYIANIYIDYYHFIVKLHYIRMLLLVWFPIWSCRNSLRFPRPFKKVTFTYRYPYVLYQYVTLRYYMYSLGANVYFLKMYCSSDRLGPFFPY